MAADIPPKSLKEDHVNIMQYYINIPWCLVLIYCMGCKERWLYWSSTPKNIYQPYSSQKYLHGDCKNNIWHSKPHLQLNNCIRIIPMIVDLFQCTLVSIKLVSNTSTGIRIIITLKWHNKLQPTQFSKISTMLEECEGMICHIWIMGL
jgi:hypothetical protein